MLIFLIHAATGDHVEICGLWHYWRTWWWFIMPLKQRWCPWPMLKPCLCLWFMMLPESMMRSMIYDTTEECGMFVVYAALGNQVVIHNLPTIHAVTSCYKEGNICCNAVDRSRIIIENGRHWRLLQKSLPPQPLKMGSHWGNSFKLW